MWHCLRDHMFSCFSRTPTCDRQTDDYGIYRSSTVSHGKKPSTKTVPALAPLMLIKLHFISHTTTTTTTSVQRPFSRTTWVSLHQKGKQFSILLEQEMMGWQWHQLDHMQVICISLRTDNHSRTSPLSFYRPDPLPATHLPVSKH